MSKKKKAILKNKSLKAKKRKYFFIAKNKKSKKKNPETSLRIKNKNIKVKKPEVPLAQFRTLETSKGIVLSDGGHHQFNDQCCCCNCRETYYTTIRPKGINHYCGPCYHGI